MNYIPRSKFPLLNNQHAIVILGISDRRINVKKAGEKGLELFQDFNIPGLDGDTLCYVA